MFARLRGADDKESFKNACDDLVRSYLDTSAVRGGALIISQAVMSTHSDDPFIFVMKCDFDEKIARISDERSLISEVEMAISARNMKSIQYPYMFEEGMMDEWELKIHQSSHARYFEDFLKFDKGVSPIELLQPESFQSVAERLLNKEEYLSDIPYLSDEQE